MKKLLATLLLLGQIATFTGLGPTASWEGDFRAACEQVPVALDVTAVSIHSPCEGCELEPCHHSLGCVGLSSLAVQPAGVVFFASTVTAAAHGAANALDSGLLPPVLPPPRA